MDSQTFHRQGYVLARSVFTPDEVAKLRSAVAAEGARAKASGRVLKSHTGEVVPVGDIAGVPGLEKLLGDPRLVTLAKELLDTRELVYFGDSGVMVGGALRGFHKDNTCRDDATHADWRSPYGLLRMGIYLQDHEHYSGGLKLRVGSHLHADVTTGRILAVPTLPGDVVIWNMRTTHSGHAVRLKAAPRFGVQPRFEGRLPPALTIPEPCERLAIFLTYGRPGEHLDAYIAKHTDLASYPNNYLYQSWLHSVAFAAPGVRFVQPIADYGSRVGRSYPDGYVATGSSRPDRYPAHGLEAVIQTAGRVLRWGRRLRGSGGVRG